MGAPTIVQTYDAMEKRLAPRLEAFVRTSHYAQLSAILVEARTAIAATVDGVAARVLHEVNLPAGTDVNSPAPASRTGSGSGGESGGFWRAGRGCGLPGGSTGPPAGGRLPRRAARRSAAVLVEGVKNREVGVDDYLAAEQDVAAGARSSPPRSNR